MPTSSLRPAMLGSPMDLSRALSPGLVEAIFDPFAYRNSAFGQYWAAAGVGYTSTANTTSNTAVIVPFSSWADMTVLKIGWLNSSSTTGNTCVAIYKSDLTRLVTTGSTANATHSVVQWVDVADTVMPAGNYYVAVNHSTTGANEMVGYSATNMIIGTATLCGIQQQAVGATALPDPIVPAALSVARQISSVFFSTVSGFS